MLRSSKIAEAVRDRVTRVTQFRRFSSHATSVHARFSLFRVGGASAAVVATAAAIFYGDFRVFCSPDEKSKVPSVGDVTSEAGSWKDWLPHRSQPSEKNYRSNMSNVPPPSVSSVEAALPSVGGMAGDAVAERGIGQMIHNMTLPAALELARDERSHLPVEQAIITKAPLCPPRITRDHPVLLKVDLETTSKVMQLTNRLKYEFWTFNDMVPGPMIRGRVGDIVELSLKNTDRTGNPHNIDCHGFEGPGGGAPITTAQQDETKVARFKLLYPGLYVYHCAAAPVPAHIMNGMYGLMLVQPEYETLPPVDKEFYVMQSEFYHEPLDNTGGNSIVEPSYPRGLDESADVVVFNGKESSLTTDSPLQAKCGDSVRMYFGNAGPNLTSSFHVIGGIFEKVWRDGDMISPPGRFIQTISVPPGGSSIVDLKPVVPGTYTLVDHAIFRLDKGAVGYLNVTGKERPDLYAGGDPQPCPGCKLHP